MTQPSNMKHIPSGWPRRATPCDLKPKWVGEFSSHADWVNFASVRLSGAIGSMGQEVPAVCIDAKGRRCSIGADFARARDEGAFPVRYFWEFESASAETDTPVPTPSDSDSNAPMATVKFRPEVWINDYAVAADPQGDTEFQVPVDFIEQADITRYRYGGNGDMDYLRDHPNCPEWAKNWPGPFEIEIVSLPAA